MLVLFLKVIRSSTILIDTAVTQLDGAGLGGALKHKVFISPLEGALTESSSSAL